ncbi:uncharacterized protein [Macrobrachium rosenbergii]|uniref:uncharacterized protein n=1 Tax=Macrobrachium rosenbergii TaxID=79674 RepID=UPI0034D7B9AC
MRKLWKLFIVLMFFGMMCVLLYVYESKRIPASLPKTKSLANLPRKKSPARLPRVKFPASLPRGKFPASLPSKKSPANLPREKFPTSLPSKKLPANLPREKLPASPPSKKSPANPPVEKFPASPPSKKSPTIPPREKFPASPPSKKSPANLPREKLPASPPSKKSPDNPPREKFPASPPSKKSPTNPPREKFPVSPPSKKSPDNPPREKLPVSPPSKKSPSNPPREKFPASPLSKKSPDNSPKEKFLASPPSKKSPANPPKEKFPASQPSKKSPANPPKEKIPPSPPSKKSPANPPKEKFPASPPSKKSPANLPREKFPTSPPSKRSPDSLPGEKFPASPSRKRSTSLPRKSPKSHLVPLRGIGDSFLPFKETYTSIEAAPQHFWFEKNMTKNAVSALDKGSLPLKKILFWNDVFGNKSFYFGFGQEPFIKAKCPVSSCFTTANRSLFSPEEVDAVIWHTRSDDQSLPSKRSPHTRYVFWSWESADNMFDNLQQFKNVFNWTFTYRLDSDIPNPYGAVYRRRVPKPLPVGKNYASGKTKLAAWFVSNCDTKSGRERLVKKLKNWINVDVYGHCGSRKCPWNSGKNGCYKKLERKYKFYFSFENTLCKNYATEKLFNVLRFNVVPVVYGFGNYTATLPPKSYIDALAFPTPENLASYLLYLDRNDTAYNEYFRWKAYHLLPAAWSSLAKPWCDLCKRLHEDQSGKVYDIYEWFIKGSQCMNYRMPKISRFIKNKAPLDSRHQVRQG